MSSPTALDTDVGELELSIRCANLLANLGVRAVRDLVFVRAGREEVEREVAAAYAALGLGRRPADQEQLIDAPAINGTGVLGPDGERFLWVFAAAGG